MATPRRSARSFWMLSSTRGTSPGRAASTAPRADRRGDRAGSPCPSLLRSTPPRALFPIWRLVPLRREKLRRPRPAERENRGRGVDAKYRATPLKVRIDTAEAPVGGQRQDQPAAIVEPVELRFRRPGSSGVDIDDIGGCECDQRTIPGDYVDIRRRAEIGRSAPRQPRIELDCRH